MSVLETSHLFNLTSLQIWRRGWTKVSWGEVGWMEWGEEEGGEVHSGRGRGWDFPNRVFYEGRKKG